MSGRSAGNSGLVSTRGDLIERTRRYRTPPTALSSTTLSYELINAVKRPGHGTRGNSINLLVNWFRIKFDHERMFIFKVSMNEVQQKQNGGRRGQPAKVPAPITHSATISKIFWKTLRDWVRLIVTSNTYYFQKKTTKNFPDLHRFVFDDLEFAFTTDSNSMRGKTLVCEHPDKEGKQVDVHFELFAYFDLNLAGDIDSNPNYHWTSIFLKHMLSQNTRYIPAENGDDREIEVSKRFAHYNGGMFFIPRTPNAPKVIVEPGVESWLGLYASVRRMENFDPVINFGLVNKLFVALNLDLISFYLMIENDSISGRPMRDFGLNSSSCMSPQSASNFNHKLKDIKLKCDCVPGKDKDDVVTGRVERHYRFIELKEDTCADREYMKVGESEEEFRGRDGRIRRRWRTRNVIMAHWYAAQGTQLKYPKLPLCVVKSGKKMDLIPMEVLFTHDQPQKYIKMLSFYARMKMTKLLARPPVQHHRYTNKMITEKLEYNDDPFMKAMKISIDRKMIECEGRVSEPCTVLGKSESDESVKLEVKKETGEFFISRAIETSNKKIRFVVYKLTDAVRWPQVGEFYRELVKKCVTRGFNVPESDHDRPPIRKEETIDRRDYLKLATLMDDDLTKFSRSGKTDDEVLVFLFFTKMIDDLYGEIKYLCDIQHGVVSQVIDEETVRKSCTKSEDEMPSDYKSIYHHLCLKLNAKLGGVNQIVGDDEPEYGRQPGHEKTMFIGIDVIHPSPNSPIRDLSLAAIVASMDKNAAKYDVRIKVNGRCNENVQHFDSHFSHLLEKYYSTNKFFPERVVILRDGVSDSEMVKAASQELNSIQQTWKKCANGEKMPPFTYIIVQKNHKTRFYQRPNQEKGEVANPPMGTVVDKDVVTPHMFDFYMVSHHTLVGTSRPIHYTVVYDDCNSSADVIQELLFRMCFLYARCSKPVSLPSPVYYAHLACERAAFHHQFAVRMGEINEILDKGEEETDQQYATRVEAAAMKIEDKLQVSRKHPGMYFI
ncbi:hypothetical protein PENTCL1PPCAC_2365 [Pristionchus entomophagus]|uniref:Piwi domain-containing protein n=1 Tax=Pristionchus entomophagus TaxID=358040 RepID=A0AAV5SJ52_9BILA|nr:hypothetical protein PENTCL1PPCAC_2365 [Pristionchus entomophagus]